MVSNSRLVFCAWPAGLLSPVYHGQNSAAAVKHLGRSYAALTEDTTRIMGRLKAHYRSQAMVCAGKKPYGSRHRDEWLARLTESGLQRRMSEGAVAAASERSRRPTSASKKLLQDGSNSA